MKATFNKISNIGFLLSFCLNLIGGYYYLQLSNPKKQNGDPVINKIDSIPTEKINPNIRLFDLDTQELLN